MLRPKFEVPVPARRHRLAVVVSHPIQHFVPFYRRLAQDPRIELRVIYCSRIGLQRYLDKDMGVELRWNMDLLSGYDHVFLPEADRITRTTFLSVNNPSVSAELRRFRPDVVKVCGYSQLTVLRTLLWSWRHGVPVVMWSDSELLHRRTGWRRLLKQAVLPLLYRRFAGFLTVGDNNEAYLGHYGVRRDKMFRTPFTIDEDSFAPVRPQREAIRTALRRELGIPLDAFVVLFVGKLIARKRPEDLARAVAKLRAHQPGRPIYALFAGNGVLMDALQKVRAETEAPCVLAGFINVDRLPHFYCAADALVHPSESDPHPLVTSEASYLGLPLILSDRIGCIGPSDTARPGENALIYPCGDVQALAEALLRLTSDISLYRRMSEASLRIATELGMGRSVRGYLEAAVAVTASGA
jgi:glycosyltransferase involved in cell wall biosynthesis